MFRKDVLARLERLEQTRARNFEIEFLSRELHRLRADFDALVLSLGKQIKEVPAHKEVSDLAKREVG